MFSCMLSKNVISTAINTEQQQLANAGAKWSLSSCGTIKCNFRHFSLTDHLTVPSFPLHFFVNPVPWFLWFERGTWPSHLHQHIEFTTKSIAAKVVWIWISRPFSVARKHYMSQRAWVRLNEKKGTWKILSKSITVAPMECFEGGKKNFCPRSVYIKKFLKFFLAIFHHIWP